MTDTHTPKLRLTKQQTATNQQVWGSILNLGFTDLLDAAIAGAATIDLTAGNATLSTNDGAADEARNITILLTGAPGSARTVFVPLLQKVYTIHNACGQTVTVRTATGTGVAVLNGTRVTVFVDEADDVVRQPLLNTDNNVVAQTGVMTPQVGNVPNATLGTSTPTYYTLREGGQIIVGTQGFTVTINSGATIVNGLVLPTSLDLDGCTLLIDDGGTIRPAFMSVGQTSIIYSRADSVAWTSPSQRIIPPHYFVLRGA